jgi:predicted ATP-grasp superfamily ATP-dependent carboligase
VRLTFALDRLQDAARSAGFVDPTLQWCDVPADGTVIPPSSPVVTALPGETNPSAALRRLTRLQRRLPEFLVDCAADEFA